jgi:hypothetical protein
MITSELQNQIKELEKQIELIKKEIMAKQNLLRLKSNEEMVRRVCREEGLGPEQTEIICKVIHCESGFDDKAVCDNGFSKDYGIIQANSYWYIKKGKFLTLDEALNNPEKCVRVMIQRYKKGFLKDWVCFSRGLYKNFTGTL